MDPTQQIAEEEAPRAGLDWRALALPALVLLIGALVLPRIADLSHMRGLIRTARPGWLLLACGVEVLRSVSNGKLFQTTLRLSGHHLGWGEMVAKVTAFTAVNRLIPAGGAGGTALMVAALQAQGIPADRALFAILLTYVYDYATYLVIVAATFVYLASIGHLPGKIALAGAFLAAVIGGVAAFGWWGLGRGERLRASITAIGARLRRLRPRRVHADSPEEAAEAIARRVTDLRAEIVSHRGRLWAPVLPALGYNLLDVFNVWCVFQAFGHPQPVAYVAAGFVIATLLGFISFIPGQLGAFEAGMAASFHTLFGVNQDVALLVTGTYRLIQFWLPIPIGAVLARWAIWGQPRGIQQ